MFEYRGKKFDVEEIKGTGTWPYFVLMYVNDTNGNDGAVCIPCPANNRNIGMAQEMPSVKKFIDKNFAEYFKNTGR